MSTTIPSLEEMSARSVAHDLFEQKPEVLYAVLKSLSASSCALAVKSISSSAITNITAAYDGHLRMDDTVVFLINSPEAADEWPYAHVPVHELPEDLRKILTIWYYQWHGSHNSAAARSNNVEQDGSATLVLDEDFEEIDEAIKEHMDDELNEWRTENAREGEEEEGEEVDDEDFDIDSKEEEVREGLKDYLKESGWFKRKDGEERQMYTKTPTITVRYVCEV